MICLYGDEALSGFRQEQLLQKIRLIAPAVQQVSTQYLYFIDSITRIDSHEGASDLHRLGELLNASTGDNARGSAMEFTVVPRLGTRSPWSSKATDIARRCGLGNVRRIERGVRYRLTTGKTGDDTGDAGSMVKLKAAVVQAIGALLHDRMTESLIHFPDDQERLFDQSHPAPLVTVNLLEAGVDALQQHNRAMGLALSDDELNYLERSFSTLQRNPSDAELMMFAQANSEHCRHKIFNANWTIDDKAQEQSLFAMIRHTHQQSPGGVLSAYHDNAAVIEGNEVNRWLPDQAGRYQSHREPAHIQIKVETHNHPTAISPFPGAATGSGGEIRDEGAVGNGAKPKAGLCGFSVSNLAIPGHVQAWEQPVQTPDHIASAFQIMQDGPIGAASFNNEFGRPNLAGYFRTYCQEVDFPDGVIELRGYHKPIMIAGGMGNIREGNIDKQPVPVGAMVVVLGGPSMLIGLGGGAASSVASGQSDTELDFASVQRGNPEMQRRCQEVIDRCIALADNSPILSMHDVGAGGLSNALPELINDAGRGAVFELRAIPNDEPGMSPMAIWSNESQERYVLAIDAEKLELFESICQRERCPYARLGQTTEQRRLLVTDAHFDNRPVDMPLDVLLGKPPRLSITAHHRAFARDSFDGQAIAVADAIDRVLALPTVAAKNFLITIGDRSVTGQVARDQLVGPWQMPVSDVAVTVADYDGYQGEAMAMGERTPVALLNPAASARMAIAESLTNIMAAAIGDISAVKLSANWMAACGHPGEDAGLFDAVSAVGMELAPALGIAIPVGKDSLSMKTVWTEAGARQSVTAPLSLIISAFAPVRDVRRTLTPQLRTDSGETDLLAVDLGAGRNRLGGSALAQVFNALGDEAPDVDEPGLLKALFTLMQSLIDRDLILAWHDRSDGGLFTTLAEMAFAGNTGVSISLDSFTGDVLPVLFNEEVGGVLQIKAADRDTVLALFTEHGLIDNVHSIGTVSTHANLELQHNGSVIFTRPVAELRRQWWQTSYQMQRHRDNPVCADQELELISRADDPGISVHLSFNPDESLQDTAPSLLSSRPSVAILRDQGVNGHFEMAAAFHKAGFDAIDVHMSDLLEGRQDLQQFKGLAACGGFSYGDVLGAGNGWASSILYNDKLASMFQAFFERDDAFALGVCNGCQMLSHLKSLIPGAEHWPAFARNHSEQYEARVVTVEVHETPSMLFDGMAGSRLPVAVAHGEGRAMFDSPEQASAARVALGFVDNQGKATDVYPLNPNGSPAGITGLCNEDGRVTIMMPHPERVVRTVCNSWAPPEWGERGPWQRLFDNARRWVN